MKKKEIKQVTQIHALLTATIDEPTGEDEDEEEEENENENEDAMSVDGTDVASISTSIATSNATSAAANHFQKLVKQLQSKNRGALAFVCRNELPAYSNLPLVLPQSVSKSQLVEALVEWVSF